MCRLTELLFEKGLVQRLIMNLVLIDFEVLFLSAERIPLTGVHQIVHSQGKKLLTRCVEHSLTHSKDVAVPFMRAHPEVLAEFVTGCALAQRPQQRRPDHAVSCLQLRERRRRDRALQRHDVPRVHS